MRGRHSSGILPSRWQLEISTDGLPDATFNNSDFNSSGIMTRALFATVAAALLNITSHAGVVRSGFDAGTLGRNDDSMSAARPLAFSNSIQFGGTSYSSVFISNNGNLTFDAALAAFTPFGLESANRAIIAPFFADVDTRHSASGVATYGTSLVDGHEAFGVTWKDVGYYRRGGDKRNSFQVVLIHRPDTGAGNFDIEFNYDRIQWETGNRNGGTGGLGGSGAWIGFDAGSAFPAFELPGSGVAGAFLDCNSATGLIHSSNVGIDGRFLYQIRDGVAVTCAAPSAPFSPIPEPATLGFGLALFGICVAGRHRRRR